MQFRSLNELLEAAKDYNLAETFLAANNPLLQDYEATGSKKALEAIVAKNQGLVIKVAMRYLHSMGHDLAIEDLISAGTEGLITAIKKFRLSTGNTLSTYAIHWIRQSIVREIYKVGFRIRIPAHVMEKVSRVNAVERLQDERLSTEALAQFTGYTLEQIQEIKKVRAQLLPNLLSIDQPISRDGETESSTLADVLLASEESWSTYSPETELMHRNLELRIHSALERLTPIQREVIVRRFGLFGNEPQTLEEIGDYMNLTRERIRQIENNSLKRLRKKARTYFDPSEAV